MSKPGYRRIKEWPDLCIPDEKDTFTWHAVQNVGSTGDCEESGIYEKRIRIVMEGKAEVQMTHFKGMKPNMFDKKVIELLETEGYVKRVGEFLCTPQFEIKKDETYNKIARPCLVHLKVRNMTLQNIQRLTLERLQEQWLMISLNVFAGRGVEVVNQQKIACTDGIYGRSKEYHSGEISGRSVITIAQVRDIFCDQPKGAKPILNGQYQSYQESWSGK